MIQLRTRTEYSFKQAFGPVKRTVAALKAMGCEAAGIVDPGTWGHVKWLNSCEAAGVKPLFGTEVVVPQDDGRRPVSWMLAINTKAFYKLSSAVREEGADVVALMRAAEGDVIRFAGSGLTDPKAIDFVDINPASRLQQAAAIALAKKVKRPLVVTSDNYYPTLADKSPFLAMGGRERSSMQHLLSLSELRAAIPLLSTREFDRAVQRGRDIAAACASSLPTAPLIKVKGNLRKVVELGRVSRLRRGHIAEWTSEYAARLKREIEAIEAKEYQSYFLVVADLIAWAKERMLVGPGRGSSAGSLLCYLVGITEVDPIPHGLLFERFIDFTRKDLPDIDIDFNDNKRELVFEYLAAKYSNTNIARIGNINTFKPKSLMRDVFSRLGIPDNERFDLANVLIEYSSGDSRYGKGIEDTLDNTDVGQRFKAKYPEAAVITEIENHASHTGVHAAGIIVSMEPVTDYCTVANGVAQVDKPDAEALNLLKIDALGLRTLGVIEDAGVVTADQLYSLKLDDPKVFDIFNQGRFSSVFQFEGAAQRQVSKQVEIDSFRAIDHVTALARPGPLGGGASGKYIDRKAGREPVVTAHPMLDDMLKDTFGVVLYQESVMRIVREVGKFSWEDTTVIRKAMSGRKGKEFFDQKGELFVKGAAESSIGAALAKSIWNEICTFGAWGMNKSHTCSYAVISYWCAYLKAYHPLEYAAACLRGAKDDDGRMAVLREMAQEGISYIPFDLERSEMDWSVKDGKLVGGFLNFHGVGEAKAQALLTRRASGELDASALDKYDLKFKDLYPLMTAYHEWYADPAAMGCEEGSEILTSDKFPNDASTVLYIGRIVEKRPLDDNETVRVARRNGVRRNGNTLFIDFRTKDDFGETIMCRVDRFNWDNFGKLANEALSVGDDVLVRGRRVPRFPMINVFKMKCLNKPDLQWAVKPRGWR